MKHEDYPARITVTQIENGFTVDVNLMRVFDFEPSHHFVFQTMAELVQFIQAHFTHRCDSVLVDGYVEVDGKWVKKE